MQVSAKIRHYFVLLTSSIPVTIGGGLVGHLTFIGVQPDPPSSYLVFGFFGVLGLIGYLVGYLVVRKFANAV